MNTRERCNIITTVLLLLITAFLCVWFLFSPKEAFSEIENKTLAFSPKLTVSEITKGAFMEDSELYITDHFPFRTVFLSIKTKSETLLGKTENNGVVFGKEEYLIQSYSGMQIDDILPKAQWIESFAESNPDLTITTMIVPNSVAVNEDLLPSYYVSGDQRTSIESIYQLMPQTNNIDLINALKIANETEPMYYRLDHHWTTQGAYVGYTAFCEASGITPIPLSDYTKTTVTEDFVGTMSSQASVFDAPPDAIERYLPDFAQELTVTYYDSLGNVSSVSDTLYEDSYLDMKDKYASFLNANQPMVVIENCSVASGKKLMVVKDSYANCMIPFLAAHYSEIYVVDLRFYAQPVSGIMADNGIRDCLILYNLINLHTDTDIYRLQ